MCVGFQTYRITNLSPRRCLGCCTNFDLSGGYGGKCPWSFFQQQCNKGYFENHHEIGCCNNIVLAQTIGVKTQGAIIARLIPAMNNGL